MIEALEQSGGNIVPDLQMSDDIAYPGSWQSIFFHTENDNESIWLKDIPESAQVNIFIGPEGGWSDDEVDTFRDKWFTQAYLGNNILRSETVSSVVSFYLKHQK